MVSQTDFQATLPAAPPRVPGHNAVCQTNQMERYVGLIATLPNSIYANRPSQQVRSWEGVGIKKGALKKQYL